MIRINNVSLPLDYDESTLKQYAARELRIPVSDIEFASIYRRSVDARKKQSIHFEAALDVVIYSDEKAVVQKNQKAKLIEEYTYELPPCKTLERPPVVIGSGPCGLFAALILACAGQNPIVIERGKDVDARTEDVRRFWSGGGLDPSSNVQFGEGGAGTFSDGKLNTGTKDARIRLVLKEFVRCGAPKEILFLAKPHIGTDKLKETVRQMRQQIIRMGGEFCFESMLTGIRSDNGRLTAVEVLHKGTVRTIYTDHAVLAIGHSARDTFQMLLEHGIPMQQKPFAMGVRIEHLQEMVNKQQYGSLWDNKYLSAADYKMAVHLKDGRGVFTFCMCPGGVVVAAASEEGRLATNGMSEFARDRVNANSAVLVGITTEDFGSEDVLAGVHLQRQVESRAFQLGGKNYHAPVQRVTDFLNSTKTTSLGSIIPSYQPGYELTNLENCLPRFLVDPLREGLILMDRKLRGFAYGDAVLTAVESRSSSPVRILRNELMQSVAMEGLYPCGEGAGYAGGIMSAAVDGIKAAEIILQLSNV